MACEPKRSEDAGIIGRFHAVAFGFEVNIECEHPRILSRENSVGIVQTYTVPCGGCWLCRRKKRREIALRCMLEAQSFERSSFLTLTYSDEPEELDYKVIQLFFKRLRKEHAFRYFVCSDFGKRFGRLHWHGILFGLDAEKVKDDVADAWSNGFVDVKPLSDARVAYASAYTAKKLMDDYGAYAHWSQGLGRAWLLRNKEKVMHDYCIWFAGQRYAIPRYFVKCLKDWNPDWFDRYCLHMRKLGEETQAIDFDDWLSKMRLKNRESFKAYKMRHKEVL